MEDAHLLLLYLYGGQRTYVNVHSEAAVCEHLIDLCERHQIDELARRGGAEVEGPDARSRPPAPPLPEVIQYDATDLFNFLDARLEEVAVLAFHPSEFRYEPMGRNWLKNRMYAHLQSLITSEAPGARANGELCDE